MTEDMFWVTILQFNLGFWEWYVWCVTYLPTTLKHYRQTLSMIQNRCPQSLLTHVSRGTKSTLNKLGVFTVSSFHAFICARSPSLLNNLLAGRGATKRRAPNLSRSNSGSSRRSMQVCYWNYPHFKVTWNWADASWSAGCKTSHALNQN